MKILLTSIGFVFVLLMSSFQNVHAGSKQHGKPSFTPEAIATFSKDVEKYAASEGARAFIIARRGRPIEDIPKGIHFTHTAIAIYSSIQLSDGNTAKGYAIHNLYQDAEEQGKSH